MSGPSVVNVFILHAIFLSLDCGTFDYSYRDACTSEGSLYFVRGKEWVCTEGGKIRRSEYANAVFDLPTPQILKN